MKWARLSLVSRGEDGGSGKLSGGLLERHVQPRRTLQRAANLRGQRGCSYRAARRPTINHAVDRIRLMLGARFQRSAANQGIWRLTATGQSCRWPDGRRRAATYWLPAAQPRTTIEQWPLDSLSLNFVLEVLPECIRKQPPDTRLILFFEFDL